MSVQLHLPTGFRLTRDQARCVRTALRFRLIYDPRTDSWWADRFDCCRATVESLDRLGVLAPPDGPETRDTLDRVLTPDGEALARLLARRAQRRMR